MIWTEAVSQAIEYIEAHIEEELPIGEIAAGYCVEMYDDPQKYPRGLLDANYYCELWIPVKRKQ